MRATKTWKKILKQKQREQLGSARKIQRFSKETTKL